MTNRFGAPWVGKIRRLETLLKSVTVVYTVITTVKKDIRLIVLTGVCLSVSVCTYTVGQCLSVILVNNNFMNAFHEVLG